MGKNKGFSFMGFVMVLIVACIGAVIAMKVVPMYIEFRAVKTAMTAMEQEEFESVAAVKESLRKRLSINYVESVTNDDIVIKSQNGGYEIYVDYYVEKPLVGNLSLTAHFEHTSTTR